MADLPISGLDEGTVLADADEFVFVDKSDTSVDPDGKTKRGLWSTIKTALSSVFASLVHTHVQSDITNLTTDLAAKVPTTRTITAGTGLTGGGDLSANRTISADIGTGAGQVAAGNHTHDLTGRQQYALFW